MAAALGTYFAWSRWRPRPSDSPPPAPTFVAPARYVGASACQKCHEPEYSAWLGSNHQLAMQEANASTVLGNFDGATFEHFGVTSTFTKKDGKFFVRTDGPDGALTDYEVKFTFGVRPLQQYLVEFPGGRLQALGIAWDSRPASEGGQRWFHLYPNEPVDHTDVLHWTGRYQNWNLMCAECHSTNLRKGYDAATNTYHTTFDEISVSCEACHGPASRHVELAKRGPSAYGASSNNGLLVNLRTRWADAWRIPSPDAKFAVRDQPPQPESLNHCAACHARRATLVEGATPGAPLEDTHRLALLADPLYFADGQQRDEVYEWGSFLQSRMYQQGVTCADCHDPHSLKTRFEGNALCARCHNAELFDTPKHHHHQTGSEGARCVTCHMPTQNYMVVHARLDHSIRVPRPDVAAITGAPDACTMCHKDRNATWAAEAMDGWYGATWRTRPQWGPAMHAGATQGVRGVPGLLAIVTNAAAPGIVRATALRLLEPSMSPQLLPQLAPLLNDANPLLRIAAIAALEPFDAAIRVRLVGPLMSDPVRGVRIEAAERLADIPADQLPADLRTARDRALGDYRAALALNADWPMENVNAGVLAMREGRVQDAIASYERAVALDPRFVAGYVNLADLHRQLGRESDAEATLRRGLATVADAADLHHSLGLTLIRRHDNERALAELAEAARLAPSNGRYVYVYAIALHSAGRAAEAIEALTRADQAHPYDLDILSALVSMYRERNAPGDVAAALACARKLAEALPSDAQVHGLVEELEREAGHNP
ncbi:MAG: tetratricopeptide repeat protein [Phycisphaerales bacterium]